MISVNDILAYADSIAPLCDALEWDNCGILCGDKNAQVTKALVCLDITKEVVDEAKEKGCELIISHHPVIFSGLKSIHPDDVAYKLVSSGIAAICLHTNLDKAPDIGVNACLANALDLKNTTLIKDEFLCIGELETTMTGSQFALFVKEKLGANGVRFTDSDIIKKVGVSSGAGSEAVEKMHTYGIDALVTGEVKHHHFLYAQSHRLCVVEAGHFATEDVVVQPLVDILSNRFATVKFEKSKSLCDMVSYL